MRKLFFVLAACACLGSALPVLAQHVTINGSAEAALTTIRSEFSATQKLPLPDLYDRTGIVNVPDSVLAVADAATLTAEGEYLRTYGAGDAADTIKVVARWNNTIKGSADSVYVLARSDSVTALIKVVITVKDLAGNTYFSGTITPTVNNTWSRAAFPSLLTMEAEELVITYTIITRTARYIDVTALRLKEAS
jgi:hypothetical protein